MVNSTRFGIELPDPGADEDAWAPILNAAHNSVEAKVTARDGDTMSGALYMQGADIDLNRPAGQAMAIGGRRNNLRRWVLTLGDATAEPGDGAGSNFRLTSFNDAGAAPLLAYSIARGNGQHQFDSGAGSNLGAVLIKGSLPVATKQTQTMLRLRRLLDDTGQGTAIDFSMTTADEQPPSHRIEAVRGTAAPDSNQLRFSLTPDGTGGTALAAMMTIRADGTIGVTAPPVAALDLATKGYIDGLFAGGGLTKPVADGYYINIEGDTMTGALQVPAGTSAAPSINFAGNLTTGIFLNGANQVGVTAGGTTRMSFTSTENVSTVKVRVPVGSAAAPAINFTGDTTTGIYQGGAGILGFATTGVARLTIGTAGIASTLPVTLPDGTAALPALAFTSDPDTGVYRVGANSIGIAAGGVIGMSVSTALISCAVPLNAAVTGSATAPSLIFNSGDTDTGLYRATTDTIGITTGGTARLTIGTASIDSTLPVVISGSSTTDMLRVTQTGTGNAFVVEDSANPDATPFVVNATGGVGIGVPSPTYALDVAGYIRQQATAASVLHLLDSSDPRLRGFYSYTGGVLRWQMVLGDNGAETGGNAGSNFYINAMDDAGAAIGIAFAINRATRNAAFGVSTPHATYRLHVNTAGVAADEFGINLVNTSAANDSSVDVMFRTGAGAARGRIRGQREAATNNGKLVFSTFIGATEGDALTLGSDKSARFAGNVIGIATAKTPASATAAGTAGDICWDSGFVYVCVAANSWKRAAIAAW